MNEIVNTFLLAEDKFLPEMYLRQGALPASLCKPGKPGFTYSGCGPFTKTMKKFKNLKKQEIQDIPLEMS